MLLPWLLLLSTTQSPLQSQVSGPGTQTLKRCPDGSILRSTDACLVFPNHRYLLTHEPSRRATPKRWWCAGSSRPNEVIVTIEQQQPAPPQGPITYVHSLGRVLIEGRLASPALIRKIGEKITGAQGLYDIGTRCLFVAPGKAVPVLSLRQSLNGRPATIEVELR